ncbi:hypothetical protein CRU87_02815 [Aliarcobacter trophiarum LMG 25534]|uniref:Membrane protein n=1 Tax=Aliarcobacter trophiarum LMG 25534 TaxID=1032241 RepID=A0AAD0QJS8_9BACT|nr:hypothetical protein [Aliarcobacter trophiarum]AXK49001.1 putative membrane protein [Aliarcobacter trophiarum LMG 25534]RXI24820.1 hypothetical protein CRU89_08375 [Aliarcobacter trophiarum]RXJ92731.1 hypothetical protein CRU87_02815 [Aliarcobacter trophiarum LMG 25534]
MEVIYPYANLIHLVLAIVFLGYVFTDIILISKLKEKINDEDKKKITKFLQEKTFRIFPISLLVIILTGGMMISKYINSNSGFFETPLQQLLIIKVVLASIIALGVLYNLFIKFTKRAKHPFMQNHFHKVVLILGFFIVILAKFMFVV